MAQPIVMPSLGMYTAEGTLASWLVTGGTHVTAGQAVAEIESDKAVVEIVAPADGVVAPIAEVGTLLKEQGLLGYILGDGEKLPESDPRIGSPPERKLDALHSNAAVPRNTPAASAAAADNSVKASPIAKKLAAQYGISLTDIKGSGPGGRIVEADVRAVVAAKRHL